MKTSMLKSPESAVVVYLPLLPKTAIFGINEFKLDWTVDTDGVYCVRPNGVNEFEGRGETPYRALSDLESIYLDNMDLIRHLAYGN